MTEHADQPAESLRSVSPGVSPDLSQFLRDILASAVLLLLALGIERLVFGAGFYSSLALHPFWIIILLVTLENGLYVGVVTAALAALVMDWPARGVGIDVTAYLMDLLTLPVLWLASAFCLGIFRQTEIRELQELRAKNTHIIEVNTALAQEILRTDQALERAELAVVTQREDLAVPTGALTALLDLESASPSALADSVQEVALHFTLMPVDLVLADANGHLTLAAGARSECGLEFPMAQQTDVFHMAAAMGRAAIAPADSSDIAGKHIVVAGIPSDVANLLAGAIVFCADTEAEAEALCPVADLLARAVYAALTQAPAKADSWSFRSGPREISLSRQVPQ